MTTWTVPATVVRVVDGDTFVLKLDLGWHITLEERCRIAGINAPELALEEGQAALTWARGALPIGMGVTFTSHSLDKYGRPLGSISMTSPQGAVYDYAAEILAAGHAVPM
jgi:endonuclease YncB( thermonuclease family)